MQGLKFTAGAVSIAASSTSGTGSAIALHDCRQVAYTLRGTGTVTGGVVKFESSLTGDYSGTWNVVGSVDFSSTPLTNSQAQGTFAAGTGGFYRLRISSNVTGGGSIEGLINGLLG